MKEYYLNPPGTTKKLGPIPEEDLKTGLIAGIYNPNALAWCEGMDAWKCLRHIFPDLVNSIRTCPPNHLVGAIVLTVLNFFGIMPFAIVGIIAIIKASSVEQLWREGRWDEACKASESARTLNRWSLFLFLLPFIAGLFIVFLLLSSLR